MRLTIALLCLSLAAFGPCRAEDPGFARTAEAEAAAGYGDSTFYFLEINALSTELPELHLCGFARRAGNGGSAHEAGGQQGLSEQVLSDALLPFAVAQVLEEDARTNTVRDTSSELVHPNPKRKSDLTDA